MYFISDIKLIKVYCILSRLVFFKVTSCVYIQDLKLNTMCNV